MKKIILLLVVLIAGCAKEPINLETLEERDDVYYTKDTNKPYTGTVFGLYKSGEKMGEGYLKGGKWDGKLTLYNEDGSINQVIEYKDGELVK